MVTKNQLSSATRYKTQDFLIHYPTQFLSNLYWIGSDCCSAYTYYHSAFPSIGIVCEKQPHLCAAMNESKSKLMHVVYLLTSGNLIEHMPRTVMKETIVHMKILDHQICKFNFLDWKLLKTWILKSQIGSPELYAIILKLLILALFCIILTMVVNPILVRYKSRMKGLGGLHSCISGQMAMCLIILHQLTDSGMTSSGNL